MPYHALPAHIVLRTDHPFQRSLDLLDADLVLAWNTRVERYEVYRKELTPRGLFFGHIERVTAPGGQGFAEPGEWFAEKLRARDSRYRPANEAAEEVLAQLRAEEKADLEAEEHALDGVREEVIKDYLPLWRKKADPDEFAKRYTTWDPEPVHFPMSPRQSMREAIREEARS